MKFYPTTGNFTQALLVMLVTNIMSVINIIISNPNDFPGITMYSPLAYWDAKNGGKRVGIIGIGGLGQMGVRYYKNAQNVKSTEIQKYTNTNTSGAFGESNGEHSDSDLDLPW